MEEENEFSARDLFDAEDELLFGTPSTLQLDQNEYESAVHSGGKRRSDEVGLKMRGPIELPDRDVYKGTAVSRRELYDDVNEVELSDEHTDDSPLQSDATSESVTGGKDSTTTAAPALLSQNVADLAERLEMRVQEENEDVELLRVKDDSNELQRAQHVSNQHKLYNSAMSTRIAVQPILNNVNRLPRPGVGWKVFRSEQNESIATKLSHTSKSLAKLLRAINDLQCQLIARLSVDDSSELRSRKREMRDDDWSDPEQVWPLLETTFTRIEPWCRATLDNWNARLSGPVRVKKRLRSIAQSFGAQIDHAMLDREKLIKRTQLARRDYEVLGENAPRSAGAYYPDLFDDADFYQILLKQVVDSSATGSSSALQWLADRKEMQKRVKRQVDTRASKGRKIRYDVHEKLLNFMAPEKRIVTVPFEIDNLFANLFCNE